MIPVTVLTGFLGSGKTTLLSGLLTSAAFKNAAVIVNEFGEIGLDHELLTTSQDSIVRLSTGCVCCVAREDLAITLGDLSSEVNDGTLAPFDRVVIETSGIADPTATAQMFIRDPSMVKHYRLEQIVTTVDTTTSERTLKTRTESVRQIALADRILLTKTDIHTQPLDDLTTVLRQINPTAPLSDRWQVDDLAGWLLDGTQRDTHAHSDTEQSTGLTQWFKDHADTAHHVQPTDSMMSYTVVRNEPLPAMALTLFLEALADHCGENILRIKGLVNLREDTDRPVVIHGVQHVFHSPRWLSGWPSDDYRTRLVFIGHQLSPDWITLLLETIVTEVESVE